MVKISIGMGQYDGRYNAIYAVYSDNTLSFYKTIEDKLHIFNRGSREENHDHFEKEIEVIFKRLESQQQEIEELKKVDDTDYIAEQEEENRENGDKDIEDSSQDELLEHDNNPVVSKVTLLEYIVNNQPVKLEKVAEYFYVSIEASHRNIKALSQNNKVFELKDGWYAVNYKDKEATVTIESSAIH